MLDDALEELERLAIEQQATSETERTRALILHDLQQAYPAGISSVGLIDRYGPCAKTRVGELKRKWDIETDLRAGPGGCCVYRLQSLDEKVPDPKRLGISITETRDKGLKVTVHQDLDGTVPPEILDRLAGKLEEQISKALARWLS